VLKCLKLDLDIFLKCSRQRSVVVTPLHTNLLRQKTILLMRNLIAQAIAISTFIEIFCFYIYALNLWKLMDHIWQVLSQTQFICVNKLLYSIFSSWSVSAGDKLPLQRVPWKSYKLRFGCVWYPSGLDFLVYRLTCCLWITYTRKRQQGISQSNKLSQQVSNYTTISKS
jgi:hypothetical protein